MAKTGITYDLVTGKVLGKLQVSISADLDVNRKALKKRGLGLIEVGGNADVLQERGNWYVENGRLERKSERVIAQEEAEEEAKQSREAARVQAERNAPANYLLEQLNELRAELGKPPIERADMQKRVKELEK